MIAAELVAAARTWLGVPFVHQGRSRLGVDCAGLVVALMRDNGLMPVGFRDERTYGRSPRTEMQDTVTRFMRPAPGPAAGVLVLIRWRVHEHASHVALLTERDTIIHSYQSAGEVVENGYRGPWLRRTAGLWLFPGVTYV